MTFGPYQLAHIAQTVMWLRSLARKGGKGVVNNIDARCLGRVADTLEDLVKARDTHAMVRRSHMARYIAWVADRRDETEEELEAESSFVARQIKARQFNVPVCEVAATRVWER